MPDTSDDFPLDPAEDTDTDGDALGDNADTDDDGDGWNDTVELLAGTGSLDNSSVPGDEDSDGIADFMDPDFLTTEIPLYNNNTEYNNNTIAGDPETPIWAYGAVAAAAIMGILAAIGFMRGGKPESIEEPSGEESVVEESEPEPIEEPSDEVLNTEESEPES